MSKSLYKKVASLMKRKGLSPIIGVAIMFAILFTFFAVVYTFRISQATEEQRRAEERVKYEIAYKGEHLSLFDYSSGANPCIVGVSPNPDRCSIEVNPATGDITLEILNDGSSSSIITYIIVNKEYFAEGSAGVSPVPLPITISPGGATSITLTLTRKIDDRGTVGIRINQLNGVQDAGETDLGGNGFDYLSNVVLGTRLGNEFTYSSPKAVIIRGNSSIANCMTTVNFDGSASNSIGATVVSWKWEATKPTGAYSVNPPTAYSKNVTFVFDFRKNPGVDDSCSTAVAESDIRLTITDSLGRTNIEELSAPISYAPFEGGGGGGGETGWEYPISHVIGTEVGVSAANGMGCTPVLVALRNMGEEQLIVGSLRFFFEAASRTNYWYAIRTLWFPYPELGSGTNECNSDFMIWTGKVCAGCIEGDPGLIVPMRKQTSPNPDPNDRPPCDYQGSQNPVIGNPYSIILNPGDVKVLRLEWEAPGQSEPGEEMCGRIITVTAYEDHEGGHPINEFAIPIARRCMITSPDRTDLQFPTVPKDGACRAPGNITLGWNVVIDANPCYSVRCGSGYPAVCSRRKYWLQIFKLTEGEAVDPDSPYFEVKAGDASAGGNSTSPYPSVFYTYNFSDGLYSWRVMTYLDVNNNGRYDMNLKEQNSDWSAFTNLRVGDCNKPIVTLTAPNGGQTFTPGNQTTITWTASDTGSGLAFFDLYYSPDNGTSWIPVSLPEGQEHLGPTIRDYVWTVPNDCTTQGMVMVIATDNDSNYIYDTSDSVFTISGTIPDAPQLVSPANNATGVLPLTGLTFDWNDSASCNVPTLRYRIQLSTSETFGTTVFDQSNIVDSEYTYTGTLNATTLYYWRVMATDSYGNSAWSTSPRSFTTGTEAFQYTNVLFSGFIFWLV